MRKLFGGIVALAVGTWLATQGFAVDRPPVGRPAVVLTCKLMDSVSGSADRTHLFRFHLLVFDRLVSEGVMFTSHLGGPLFAQPNATGNAQLISSSRRDDRIQTIFFARSGNDSYTFEITLAPDSQTATVRESYVYQTSVGRESGSLPGEYQCSETDILMPN